MWSIDEDVNQPQPPCDWHAWVVHRLRPNGPGFFMAVQFPSQGVTESAAQTLVRRIVDGLNREESELTDGTNSKESTSKARTDQVRAELPETTA